MRFLTVTAGELAAGVVARQAGFGDPERMRRAFVRNLGQLPPASDNDLERPVASRNLLPSDDPTDAARRDGAKQHGSTQGVDRSTASALQQRATAGEDEDPG